MNNYIILSEKTWHKQLFFDLKNIFPNDSWLLVNQKEDFTIELLKRYRPHQIFVPHWSYIIPEEIYLNFECIVFHMTDLPYGRGGSPLQNLIVRGHQSTKISAIKVEKGIDTGGIYLKMPLSLKGTAQEIFNRATPIIQVMITEIIQKQLQPIAQSGEIETFKRRKPEEGNLEGLIDLSKLYDYIRMLDCEGYPPAFIESQYFKFEFSGADFDSNKQIINAHVRIIKK